MSTEDLGTWLQVTFRCLHTNHLLAAKLAYRNWLDETGKWPVLPAISIRSTFLAICAPLLGEEVIPVLGS
jgi:hypothetical protein